MHGKGLTTFASYGWTFDEGNRLLQFVSSVDGTVDYTYDANEQLTGAEYDYQSDESYSYDANGNRTTSGYDIGDNNQTLSDGTYDYEYDDEGNRTKKTILATGAWTEYVWDHRNRLTKVLQKNSGGSVLTTIDYEYDVFDRRIARIRTPAVGAAISQHFVYDGDHIALQFDGGTLTHRYLYGPVVDQILADEQLGTGDVLWPLTDNLGSVRDIAIYDAGTDTTSIANHIVYDAFGRVISETNSAVDLLFGYTGRDWDAQAELQYNRARWYDPKIGQWLSEDPIGFEAGDANERRYVGNGVTTKVDPSGLQDGLFGSVCSWLSTPVTTPTQPTKRHPGDVPLTPFIGKYTELPKPQQAAAVATLNNNFNAAANGVEVGVELFPGGGLLKYANGQHLTGEPIDNGDLAGDGLFSVLFPAIGVFSRRVGPLLNKPDDLAGGMQFPSNSIQTRLNHIFGNPDHMLDILEQKYGSQDRAFNAIQRAANQALAAGKLTPGPDGILPTSNAGNIIDVDGILVRLIGGRVSNGQVQISSASRKGL